MLTPTSMFLLASSTSASTNDQRSLMSFSFLKHHAEAAMPPAPKRRRLGETILETALNAALIGTAVGITAFKLYANNSNTPLDLHYH